MTRTLWLALVLGWPASAWAEEFEAFQHARDAYEAGDHALAVERFEQLLGGEPSQVRNLPLRLESRKYLGASYLFIGAAEAAALQFERLLREDPDYLIDPLAFPAEVLDVFERVRVRLEQARGREQELREQQEREARRREMQRLIHERQQLQLLADMAQTEVVEERRSRWIAMLPFGAGQFQNGHTNLGVGLAISQGLLLATHIGTFIAHENLRGVRPAEEDLQRAGLIESSLRITNQLSLGLFVAVVLAGIVDAQIRFKDRRVTERQRPLPPELQHFLNGDLAGSPALGSFRF